MSSASAAARIQIAISAGKSKPKPKRPNAVRRIMDREQSRERRVRESSVTSNTGAAPVVARKSSRSTCANKECPNPNVVEGTCQTCGSVADESNIVSEITFGETSSGAAVVHGTNLAADQAGVRLSGLAFRRVAGGNSEQRERSFREVKTLINQYAQQLRVSTHIAETAHRFYRVASNNNFVQGRHKARVAAICLYAACRKEPHNKVMLIDLADILETDVFLLGRHYKEFLNQFPDMTEGTNPIMMEDLIHRFAMKLEFHHDTTDVAMSAVRIARRMWYDNITHGRRPAGICGAAIIMAARAHNYRRTVREVVFIAKVTMATLQERMEEFAMVPTAQMTISQFNETHKDQPSGPSHDPPFVYKNTDEWKEKHGRRRKRKAPTTTANDESQEGDQNDRDKRPRVEADPQEPQQPVSGPSTSTRQTNNPPVRDNDGFVVPPLPPYVIDPALRSDPAPISQTEPTTEVEVPIWAVAPDVENQAALEALASEFGDSGRAGGDEDDEEEIDPTSEMAMAVAQGIEVPGVKKPLQKAAKTPEKKKTAVLPVDEEWEMDEAYLEQEMEDHLNDPALIGASQVEKKAIEASRAKETSAVDRTATPGETAPGTTISAAEDNGETNEPQPNPKPERDPNLPLDPRSTPRSKVSDDPIVHEDEFKDDIEVQMCLLAEHEIKVKERIWSNNNKDYLRIKQQKQFQAKLAENAPKRRRQRAQKPRIGEGQATPAESAEEAAANMIRSRGISKKINYSTLGQVFDLGSRGPGSSYGASSVGPGSVAGSEMGSDDEGDHEGGSRRVRSPSPRTVEEATPAPANGQSSSTATAAAAKPTVSAPAEEEEEEEEGDDEDYNHDTSMQEDYNDHNGYEEEQTFAEDDYDPFGDNDDGNEDGYDDAEY